MLFRRKQEVPAGTAATTPTTESARSCPTLAKALKKLESLDKPHILDLGELCGKTAVYLADRGSRVSVETFVAPEPPPAVPAEGEPPPLEPFVIEQPDASFDLVLAWEALDYTPPKRLEEVAAELGSVDYEG